MWVTISQSERHSENSTLPARVPDIAKMSKSKSPKRVFLVSLASSDSETTKERIFRLFASLFQCSRVAVSAIPRADESGLFFFYVLFLLYPGLLWSNVEAFLRAKVQKEFRPVPLLRQVRTQFHFIFSSISVLL